MTPVALSIAGSDPSGGAGIQADLKTLHRFGVYGEAVITLITVQNTHGVTRVETLDPSLVVDQLEAVLADIPPHAAKTGALGSAAIVAAIARAAEMFAFPLIVDPVMLSKNGASLASEEALRAMIELLIPRAHLLMPNLDEAGRLTGMPVTNLNQMQDAGEKLRQMGALNVLIKGGHLEGDAVDLLLTEGGAKREFRAARIPARHTHGTGCTLSAAVTAELAKGTSLEEAIERAKTFVTSAIRTSPGLGGGCGPLNLNAT